jgi:hypothetical protein
MATRIRVNAYFRKKIILGVIIIGFLATIGTILYVDYNYGDYVWYNDQNRYELGSIEIAEALDFEMSSSRLEVSSYLDAVGMTYSSLELDEIIGSEGQYIDLDHQYLAYSFYIKNTGSVTKSITYNIRLSELMDWMSDSIRILIIEDDTNYKMYQKEDQLDLDNNLQLYDQMMPTGINFETTAIVFRDTIEDLEPGSIKSFRLIIWLEEQDPDLVERADIGIIQGEFVFTVIDDPAYGGSNFMSSSCVVSFGIHYQDEDIS